MGTAMKPSDVTTNESALVEAKAKDPTQDPNYCGTCYGAEEHPGMHVRVCIYFSVCTMCTVETLMRC